MHTTVQVEIPDGWELACDEIREPRQGEHYMSPSGVILCASDDYRFGERRVIVRESWQWPEWLNAAAVCKTKWNVWWACERIPTPSECPPDGWEGVGATMALGDLVKFEPPPCDDWRDSLRVNPNREGEHV